MSKQYTENSVEKLKRGLNGKSIVAILIFGAIVATFIFADFSPQATGSGSAATVNGRIISLSEFQNEVQMIEQYYKQLFGNSMDFSSQRQLLQQQALESLIRNELVSQGSEKEHIYATDADVREFLLNDIPYLQENGVFNRELYSRYLEFTRSSPAQFESKIRKNILEIRTRRLFETANKPTQMELDKLRKLKETKLNIQFAQLSQDEFTQSWNYTPAQAEADLKDEAFLKTVQSEFEKTKSSYEKEEQVKAQHILVQGADDAALAKAQQIRERLKKEDFAKVAKEVSDDPGSKNAGGDLGFFTKTQMVKEFSDSAFALPIGEISAPVKSSFGYHIIKVNAKLPAQAADFEKQKFEVAKKVQAEKAWNDFILKWDDLVRKGNETEISDFLKQNKLAWKESGFFDLSQDAIPQIQNPQSVEALNEISREAPLLKRLLRDGRSVVALKLKEVKTEVDPTFNADESNEILERQRGQQLQNEWINSIRKTSQIQTNSQLLSTM